ncbi:nodulation-signaling pathway 2 protein-like [Neltuma alba]|uniref:nodulation-signaling pathway 2 protein-like n=1 Tax=Neltuma alba TaxID=207710 RepID=UPI0010A2B79E|nr:nodulation-signaling pathway 2 protein-like [Prosopis alba]
MEPETEHSWSSCEGISSTFDPVESFDFNVDALLFPTSEDASSAVFCTDHVYFPIDELPSLIDDFSMDLDAFDATLSSQSPGIIHGCPEEGEGISFASQNPCFQRDVWSPTTSMQSGMSKVVQAPPSLIIPGEDMEMENQLSLPHLLEAIGEALEQGQKILRRISHKVSPLGDPLERLAFILSQNHDDTEQGSFIKQEACKSFHHFFKAIYQGLPHGRIAHFAANSVILGSIPADSEVIHIIDSDMGEGGQWPPLMEAIAQQHKTLKLTAITLEEEESPDIGCVSTQWKFEEIRRKLYEHAKSCGLKLKVEEQRIEELVTELKKLNKRSGHGNGKRNFVAFNCMAGLPHMGRVRSRRHVLEFLQVAKDFIKSSTPNRGIIAFGDGEACEKLRNSTDFMSFFNGHLEHYHALLESIESNFPFQFSEARTAMENLFVAPYISCEDWLRRWEEMRQCGNVQSGIELERGNLREETLMEAGEMLRGMEGSYEVKIEGNNGNEMVLHWKGTQLLRISTWAN